MAEERSVTASLSRRLAAPLLLGAMTLAAWSGAARAETLKQCSAQYQAAKTAGTLNGQDWKAFRKAQCSGTGPAATGATPAAAPAAAVTPAPASTTPAAAAPAAAAAAGGSPVFPSTVSAKYSSLTPGKARMKTCLDQYHANKTGNGNGGLKWIQKGGGYYSECSKHLQNK